MKGSGEMACIDGERDVGGRTSMGSDDEGDTCGGDGGDTGWDGVGSSGDCGDGQG